MTTERYIGTRDRQVYITRRVYHSLRAIAKAKQVTPDELANEWLQARLDAEYSPIVELYKRHEAEEKEALDKLNDHVKSV